MTYAACVCRVMVGKLRANAAKGWDTDFRWGWAHRVGRFGETPLPRSTSRAGRAFFLGRFRGDVSHSAGFATLFLELLHLGLFLGHALDP